MKFHAAALQQFGESLLTASGLAPDRARDVAEILLEGDLLGHTTHGFAPLNSAVGATSL
jgi:LDH2 family malate/lactate/ureidoglycolate dehydrogenase